MSEDSQIKSFIIVGFCEQDRLPSAFLLHLQRAVMRVSFTVRGAEFTAFSQSNLKTIFLECKSEACFTCAADLFNIMNELIFSELFLLNDKINIEEQLFFSKKSR